MTTQITVPTEEGTAVKLNTALPGDGGDIRRFEISPDNTRIIYVLRKCNTRFDFEILS